LGLSLPFREWMDRAIADLGVALLPINVEYADAAANLPNHDGDPFDRMIVGQAHVEGMSVASGNAILDKYRINRLW
jgi:PIN domain nuclease of toxin-antitoxin system